MALALAHATAARAMEALPIHNLESMKLAVSARERGDTNAPDAKAKAGSTHHFKMIGDLLKCPSGLLARQK
jgi:hypothetical protein